MKNGISIRLMLFCLVTTPGLNSSVALAEANAPGLKLECSTAPSDEVSRDILLIQSDGSGAPWRLSECAGDERYTQCREAGAISVGPLKRIANGTTQIEVTCSDCDAAFDSAMISLPSAELEQQQSYIQGSLQQLSQGKVSAEPQKLLCRVSGSVKPATELPQSNNVACSSSGTSAIYDEKSGQIILSAKNGEALRSLADTKQIRVQGKHLTLAAVELTARNMKGWIAQDEIRTILQCSFISAAAVQTISDSRRHHVLPKPTRSKKRKTDIAAAEPTPNQVDASQFPVTCAQKIILAAAKQYERSHYDDRPESGGTCAFGVNRELTASHIGGISGGFGEGAVDFTIGLPAHGYVDTGLRDPKTAPPGSVIVFAGPKSALYLRTGEQEGSSAGTWAGHVTIKGDDGYYYTDARTKAPAVGWNIASVNIAHVRNVIGIYIPGPTLVQQYANKCDK